MERRLRAILIADMVGYSRLMETDEVATLDRQKRHRADLIDPAFAAHGGRIFKETGDGLLAEFPSVVEAVTCAVKIQRAMSEREADQPEDRRIRYRVGINLGDVIHDAGDVYGDGVNVAARLEQLADPGGVCISGAAYDQLRGAVEVGYEDQGDMRVKNIERPIRVWKLLLDPAAAGQVVGRRTTAPRRSRLVLAAGILLVLGGLAAWWGRQPEFTPADPARYAFALPEKPSIAVLAFDNLSGDAANDYIGDGLSENIIATLAASPKLFVIARNSSFHYKGTATPVQTIAEDLGVRYVLEGSMQKSGDSIRVTAQLIDALDGRHIWADTFDRELSVADLFTIQDEVTGEIARALDVELVVGKGRRSPFTDIGDLETIVLVQKAVAEFQKFSPEGNEMSEKLLLQAVERQPNSADVLINLGWATWYKLPLGQSDDPATIFARARDYATRAIENDPGNQHGYALLAWLDMYQLNHDAALKNAQRAVELNPGGGIATSVAGWVISTSGYPERGAELLRFGMRTEPYYPDWIPNALASSLMMLGQYDEAATILETLVAEANPVIRRWARNNLSVIAVWQGDIDTARALAAITLAEAPRTSIAVSKRYNYVIRDQAYQERIYAAQRAAGWPETPPTIPQTED